MLQIVPDYYGRFRCLAGACRHSCCIGWEIDVDEQALACYSALPGALGEKLRGAVSQGDTPHFLLTAESERCPFLTEGNLCELILSGGEELLCQICRDHPRFRTFLPDRTETGLGLCCEAAAALVLAQKERPHFVRTGEDGEPDRKIEALLAIRDDIMSTIFDRSLSLDARMEEILRLTCAKLPARNMAAWAEFLLPLERLDESWTELLYLLGERGDSVNITQFQAYMSARVTEYEQLLAYFIFRHFMKGYEDGDPSGKAAFAVLSVRIILTLGALLWEKRGGFTFDDQAELSRMYSAEIEYSEDNLDALFDELYQDPWSV